MRFRTGALIGSMILCLLAIGWSVLSSSVRAGVARPAEGDLISATKPSLPENHGTSAPEQDFTNVVAHNLELRKGPEFKIYVPWLRGRMVRTRHNVNPSFDEPESFVLDVQTGIIRANIGDLVNYLNTSAGSSSPLKHISVSGDADHVKIHGTVRKIVSLPVDMEGTISPSPGRQIRMHVTKLSVVKLPLRGILGAFKLTVADLFNAQGNDGIRVSGNDVFFDTQKLLPPPHLGGEFTSVRVRNPDIEVTYGDAKSAIARVGQWRNFLRLQDGSIDFGKLTMHHVDLVMIDTSNDPWFDLDLSHYQEQLVNGYTRMTPQAGLQIFMPDLTKLPKKSGQKISIEWMKNRNIPPPPEVMNR